MEKFGTEMKLQGAERISISGSTFPRASAVPSQISGHNEPNESSGRSSDSLGQSLQQISVPHSGSSSLGITVASFPGMRAENVYMWVSLKGSGKWKCYNFYLCAMAQIVSAPGISSLLPHILRPTDPNPTHYSKSS